MRNRFFAALAPLPTLLALLMLAPLIWAGPAIAKEAPPAADDPALERRAMHLAAELRCLVCQNQTIADSNAGLAVDLRNQIREQLKKGASDADVIGYMVARYGDFVLYRPPFKASTALLWLGPLILVLGGLLFLYRVLAARRGQAAAGLTEEERQRARALLDSQ
jgi:cytochrome c-type biogenesis protein CcmH